MSTTPTQNDSFPLPGYEDRLWEELEQLHTELSATPGTPAPNRPRRRYLMVVGGMAAAAIVGTFALVVTEDGTTRTSNQGDPVPETTSPPPTDAVDPAEQPKVIAVYETRFGDGMVSTMAADEETLSSHLLQVEADGSLGFEDFNVVTVDEDGTRTGQQTSIDHVTGEYTTFPAHEVVEIQFNHQIAMAEIADGNFDLVGTEQLDGVEAQKYVSRPVDPATDCLESEDTDMCVVDGRRYPDAQIAYGTRTVWVDPVTGRPVKEEYVPMGDGGEGPQGSTTTFRYLERTPENLAQFELEIPEGFREVEEMSRSVG